jgi:hypothetical protein
MMLNDRLGDCIIADGPGHATQVWTLNATGTIVTPPDSLILETYEKWCGYNPADPNTDQGGVELDVLNHWQKQGFAGQPLDAYAAIDLEQGPHPVIPMMSVMDAIWLFGGAYIGVELPITAQNQEIWEVPLDPGLQDEPGSWGGHAIYIVAYDQNTLTCITWGQLKKMTWAWFEKYCSEAYALVSKDWMEASGIAPSGFDLATLESDLRAVSAQPSALS